MTESVTVAGTQPLIRHDHHQVGGVVTRDQIERLPLNGRNFLELAKLEPGVTNPARLADGRVFVSSLGGGLQTIPRIGSTRVTVDGASISTPGTVGVLLQVSQDVVQEFQIATVNFDLTSSLTSNGAINIVTRSGGNAYHGSGFYFHRDHHLAAYPGLSRDPKNADPSFERHQFGSHAGGPLRKDRAFFFGSFERADQVGVASIQPTDEFAPLGGIFPSPYVGNQVNARVDVQLHRNHNAFARYTYDRNNTFANVGPSSLPSGWSRRINQADQGLAALTSVLSARIVNDVRFSYFSSDTPVTPASSEDCPNCFGLGEPRATVADVGLTFGGRGNGFGGGAPLPGDREPRVAERRPQPPLWFRLGARREHAVHCRRAIGRNHALFSEAGSARGSAGFSAGLLHHSRGHPAASAAKFFDHRRSRHRVVAGIPRPEGCRSLSSLCRRYVARPPSTDAELWPRMVVRAECAQPRSPEARASHPDSRR